MSNVEIILLQNLKNNNNFEFLKKTYTKIIEPFLYVCFIVLIYITIKLYIFHCLLDKIYKNNKFRLLKNESYTNYFFEKETKEKINITLVLKNKKTYKFIQNLVEMSFKGRWKNLIFYKNSFGNKEGNLELYFKIPIRYKKFNNFSKTNVDIFFELKDGAYDDYYIKGNFTLNFPELFFQNLNFLDYIYPNDNKTLEPISFINKKLEIDYASCEILSFCKKNKLDNLTLEVIFFPIKKSFSKGFKSLQIFDYTKIKFQFYKEKNFKTEMEIEGYNIEKDITNARNYTFMVIIVNLIQLYYVTKNLNELIRDNEKCYGYDLITITMSIITKALISTCHFYRSNIVNDDTISFYFSTIAIIYFFDLTLIETRTLFLCFKVNYLDYIQNDRIYYRTKIMIFGSIFYVFIFICLVLCRLLVMNYICCFCLFLFSYIFQIFYSIKVGIRPPMSKGYLISSSIAKLFFPIYLKAYPYNIFELQSAYLKSFSVCITVIIEVIILILQKEYGARFLVPHSIRCAYYNYYFDDVKINEHISENPDCIICLDQLKINENEELIVENNSFFNDRNIFFFDNVSKKINNFVKYVKEPFKKKPFMITPCDHIFHTECLEKWIQFKNECPYCKREIPGLD